MAEKSMKESYFANYYMNEYEWIFKMSRNDY